MPGPFRGKTAAAIAAVKALAEGKRPQLVAAQTGLSIRRVRHLRRLSGLPPWLNQWAAGGAARIAPGGSPEPPLALAAGFLASWHRSKVTVYRVNARGEVAEMLGTWDVSRVYDARELRAKTFVRAWNLPIPPAF